MLGVQVLEPQQDLGEVEHGVALLEVAALEHVARAAHADDADDLEALDGVAAASLGACRVRALLWPHWRQDLEDDLQAVADSQAVLEGLAVVQDEARGACCRRDGEGGDEGRADAAIALQQSRR